MSGIYFGFFECVGKTHSLLKSGKEKFLIKFEDEHENKVTVKVNEATFTAFSIGTPLPWKLVKRQGTLKEATE